MSNKVFALICAGVIALSGIVGYKINKPELADGIYKAVGTSYNYRNYKPFLVVEVKNGRMTNALYDFVDSEGKLITNDRKLKGEMIQTYSNSPDAITGIISSEFLIKQDTSTIKSVSSINDGVEDIFIQLADGLMNERIKDGNAEILEVNTSSSKDGAK